MALPQKDIYHVERIPKAATRWLKCLRGLTHEGWLKAVNVKPLKNEEKNCFGPDPQLYTVQPNRPGSNSTVHFLQKARIKKIVIKPGEPKEEDENEE